LDDHDIIAVSRKEKKMKPVLVAIVASLATRWATLPDGGPRDPKPSLYTDSLYGFSIQAPPFSKAGPDTNVIPVMLLGPSDDEFSPNMNVLVQNTSISFSDFAETSRKQFETAGLRITRETSSKIGGRDALTWVYEGMMQGHELRWLARAIAAKGRIYLITYTSLAKNYAKYEKAFLESLESFKLAD
jgi:hypothetical protein